VALTWIESCGIQQARLQQTIILLDKVQNLMTKAPQRAALEWNESLHSLRQQINRQLERLLDRRFEVAVIGLEKAGKSALLNAWLGEEILPSSDVRCTYTTTEIWSAASEEEQMLIIEYHSQYEIDQLLAKKREELTSFREGSRDHDDLIEEIQETEHLLPQIYEYTARLKWQRGFRDISEIANELQQAVFSNRAQARAIKRIQLKTIRLHNDRDIVFHDVPGFDSPVEMHQRQAREKLATCDAILYAKEMKNPNINSPEKNMLQVADIEDPHIKVADKIFIALTKADTARDRNEFDRWASLQRDTWKYIPEKRQIPVCAAAHLTSLGTGTQTTIQNGRRSITQLAELQQPDGIELLKKSVFDYLDNERVDVLTRRCDGLVRKTHQTARKLIEMLDPVYGQIVDENEQDIDLFGADFGRWWGAEWKRIEREFENWYVQTVQGRSNPDASASDHEYLQQLHSDYRQTIERLLSELPTAQRERMQSIYVAGGSELTMVPSRGNSAIRRHIYDELVLQLEKELTEQLTQSLERLIDQVVGESQRLLWNIPDVRSHLLDNSEQKHARFLHGIETLFLRFGRDALEIFIFYPRHERENLIRERDAEIKTLSAFYRGQEKGRKDHLETYLRAGIWILKTASEAGVITPAVGKGFAAVEKMSTSGKKDIWGNSRAGDSEEAMDALPKPRNFEDVAKEIEEDLKTLEDYLLNSVFYVAGFITYCKQELERIRKKFTDLENNDRVWMEVVRTQARRENPAIPFKVATKIQDFRMRREIALELREVKEMMSRVN